MAQVTELGQKINILGYDGNRIACQVAGPKDAQSIVLTSGIGCGPVFFKDIAPELARKYKVIFWDFRAHGKSELAPDSKSYKIEHHARDLEAVVSQLTDGSPIMVSFSMGVQVTLEWAKLYGTAPAPAYVFLLGMPCNPLRSHWLFGNEEFKLLGSAALDFGLDRIVPHLHPLSKAILRNYLAYRLGIRWGLISSQFSYRDYYEFIRYSSGIRPDAWLRTGLGVLNHDAIEYWEKLDSPILFIGAENDVIVPARECRSVSPLLSRGQYRELNNRSHAGMAEVGEKLAQDILLFIEKQVPMQAANDEKKAA